MATTQVKTVRAKFEVVAETRHANYPGKQIKMHAVYSADPNHENKTFWDATPSADLTMTINKNGPADFFELGKAYYLDFTLAD